MRVEQRARQVVESLRLGTQCIRTDVASASMSCRSYQTVRRKPPSPAVVVRHLRLPQPVSDRSWHIIRSAAGREISIGKRRTPSEVNSRQLMSWSACTTVPGLVAMQSGDDLSLVTVRITRRRKPTNHTAKLTTAVRRASVGYAWFASLERSCREFVTKLASKFSRQAVGKESVGPMVENGG